MLAKLCSVELVSKEERVWALTPLVLLVLSIPSFFLSQQSQSAHLAQVFTAHPWHQSEQPKAKSRTFVVCHALR